MRSMDEEARRFNEILRQTEANRHWPAAPDLDAYDQWLEQCIARWRGEPPAIRAVPAGRDKPTAPPPNAPAQDFFGGVDYAMQEEFGLCRFMIPAGLQQPTRTYARTEDFMQTLLSGLQLSPAEIQSILQQPPDRLRHARVVYLPGQGCLVNEAAFQLPGGRSLKDKSDTRIPIIREYTFAKWGHGFIGEYTRFGREMVKKGLWSAWQARELGIRLPRLQEKYTGLEELSRSFGVAARGWCEWLWEYLACKAHSPVGEELVIKRPSIRGLLEDFNKVLSIFPLIINLDGVLVRLLDMAGLLSYAFVERSRLAPMVTNQILGAVEAKLDVENRIPGSTGEAFFGQLSWMYYSLLESQLSGYNIPYAVLLLFHCSAELTGPAHEKGESQRTRKLEETVDGRLALLLGLQDAGARTDPHGLKVAAWERLKLDGPQEYLV